MSKKETKELVNAIRHSFGLPKIEASAYNKIYAIVDENNDGQLEIGELLKHFEKVFEEFPIFV